MIYKDLSEVLELLNEIEKKINKKDFLKIIEEFKKSGKCKQILDEFDYQKKV
jgi:hypothetical protein